MASLRGRGFIYFSIVLEKKARTDGFSKGGSCGFRGYWTAF
jgi:hypothetical protein